ncbi:hypothetical protein H072_9334 [Dactylellina haptotyla CBS 200.50]|uniref:Glucan endo-1,3-beta-glucosidase eglC n=1 Tax=Dactylellina haptotyla (strain CBS 200.50) TaxID=1284197 RepID=S8A247_DACHA|nr:hypothetical protein H072_9334 [Dactylellina haptotyla CBS 200.50]
MVGKSLVLSVLAAVAAVNADEYLGFNYGATKANGQIKVYDDFKEEFELAQKLPGAAGKFTSARLYTMIQGPSKDDPITAFQAAIDTKTSILLGIWCSAGPEIVNNEISALTKAIKQYGTKFTDLVVGLSVGSEDLYRNSVMGIENKSGIGAQPNDLVNYIKQVRAALAGTPLSKVQIGHVDTWTVWVNGTNQPVIDALDWIGFDAYPYFQSTMANSIDVAADLFWQAYETTQKATGKEVWITETGWPVAGKDMNLAKANVPDAQQYWNQIGCAIFGKYKTWWYMLRDADPDAPETEFGVLDKDLTPYYDLSCKNAKPVNSPLAATSTTGTSPATTGGSRASQTSGMSTLTTTTSSVSSTVPTTSTPPPPPPAPAPSTSDPSSGTASDSTSNPVSSPTTDTTLTPTSTPTSAPSSNPTSNPTSDPTSSSPSSANSTVPPTRVTSTSFSLASPEIRVSSPSSSSVVLSSSPSVSPAPSGSGGSTNLASVFGGAVGGIFALVPSTETTQKPRVELLAIESSNMFHQRSLKSSLRGVRAILVCLAKLRSISKRHRPPDTETHSNPLTALYAESLTTSIPHTPSYIVDRRFTFRSTYAVDAPSAPTSTGTSGAQATDPANSGFAVKATMGFVAAQALVAAFFLL